jgi:hypothetical protein
MNQAAPLGLAALALAAAMPAAAVTTHTIAAGANPGTSVAADQCERNGPYRRSGTFGMIIGCGRTEFYSRSLTSYKALVMAGLLVIGVVRLVRRGKRP